MGIETCGFFSGLAVHTILIPALLTLTQGKHLFATVLKPIIIFTLWLGGNENTASKFNYIYII